MGTITDEDGADAEAARADRDALVRIHRRHQHTLAQKVFQHPFASQRWRRSILDQLIVRKPARPRKP